VPSVQHVCRVELRTFQENFVHFFVQNEG